MNEAEERGQGEFEGAVEVDLREVPEGVKGGAVDGSGEDVLAASVGAGSVGYCGGVVGISGGRKLVVAERVYDELAGGGDCVWVCAALC